MIKHLFHHTLNIALFCFLSAQYENCIEDLIEQGDAYYSQGDYSNAIIIYEDLLAEQELIYENIQNASPAPGISEAILNADGVFICPSNPFISIGPILAVPEIRELLIQTAAPIFAITPIVNQRALKGPTAKMLEELDYPVSPITIAKLYRDFLDVFVLDDQDVQMREEIETMGLKVVVTNTVMKNDQEKIRLANELLEIL